MASQRGIGVKFEAERCKAVREPKFAADENTSMIADRLDKISKAAGDMFCGVDRCPKGFLKAPLGQSLAGERVIADRVWESGTVGVGGESSSEAELVCDVTDAAADVVDCGEFSMGDWVILYLV